MKNHFKSIILLFILLLLILAACRSDNNEDMTTSVSTNETGHLEEISEDRVRITITINEGQQYVNEQEVEFEEEANLLEVLEDTFYVETNDENEIMSIERMQADEEEGTTWVYFIDDEKSNIPVDEYTLEGGEIIIFDLQ